MVVTIEVQSGGYRDCAIQIETLYVWNISDLADVSDYEYQFTDPRDRRRPAGEIKGHERAAGAWELVRRIMVQEFGAQ